MKTYSPRIKTKPKEIVKVASSIAIFLTFFGFQSQGFAQDEPETADIPVTVDQEVDDLESVDTSDSENSSAEETSDPFDNLPKIRARTYRVTVANRSDSMRTYLFSDPRPLKPRVGKIILLRNDADQNVMAFRVIRNYRARGQFAATRVRKYDNFHVLENGEKYTSIEKISDIIPLPTSSEEEFEEAEDLEDLEEDFEEEPEEEEDPEDEESFEYLEEESDVAEDLSGGYDVDDFEDEISFDDLVIEEGEAFDRYIAWLSANFGLYLTEVISARASTTNSAEFENRFLTGFGMSFGLSLLKRIFLRGNSVQDSLMAEGGLALYSVLNPVEGSTTNDSYTFINLHAVGRYNLWIGPDFIISPFGGIKLVNIIAAENADDNQLDLFPFLGLTFGGTAFVKLGPQWWLRADIALDTLTLGLILRF